MRTGITRLMLHTASLAVTMLAAVSNASAATVTVGLTAERANATMTDGMKVAMWGYCASAHRPRAARSAARVRLDGHPGRMDAGAHDLRRAGRQSRRHADEQPAGRDVVRHPRPVRRRLGVAGERPGGPRRASADHLDDLARGGRRHVHAALAGGARALVRAGGRLARARRRLEHANLRVRQPATRHLSCTRRERTRRCRRRWACMACSWSRPSRPSIRRRRRRRSRRPAPPTPRASQRRRRRRGQL